LIFLFNDFEWVGAFLAKKWLKESFFGYFSKKYNILVIRKKPNSKMSFSPIF